jgi:hypothetical protein
MDRPRLIRVLLPLLVLLTWQPSARAAAAPPGVRELKSRHYRIFTDLDPNLSQDLARRLDAMYETYADRLKGFNNGATEVPRFQVYLFRRQRDYLKLTGERMKNTGGIFMSGRNLLASFLEGQGRDALRRTLQHEAFHQFAHSLISPELPVWLNEGLAQVFEEAVWNGSEFSLEQVPPRRIRQLDDDIDNRRLVKFETLMALTPEQWAKRLEDSHDAGATQYNQSWAMTYFLINARGDDDKPRYRPRLLQMLALIHQGEESGKAFKIAFGDNLPGFQKRFLEFADTLKPTKEATLMENQEVLADLLVKLREQGLRFDRVSDLREAAVKAGYRMNYVRGGLKWSSNPNVETYFRDTRGRPFHEDELYFFLRAGAPLPDIVCRWSKDIQFRTRFYEEDGRVEHESLIETPSRGSSYVGAGS